MIRPCLRLSGRSATLFPELIHSQITDWKMCGSSPCLFSWVEWLGQRQRGVATLPSLRGQQACHLVTTQWGRSGFYQKTTQPKRGEWTSSAPTAQGYCCRNRCFGNTFKIFGWRSHYTKYQILNS